MKVSIICVISLDGYLNPILKMSPRWSSREDHRHLIRATKRSGVVIMGQNTFTYSYFKKALPERWNIVVTHDTDQKPVENVWFTNDAPKTILEAVQKKGYDEVVIVGGSMINSLFMNAGLVTDLYITVTSSIFGSGIPLFANLDNPLELALKLVDSSPLGPGEILNHYKVM